MKRSYLWTRFPDRWRQAAYLLSAFVNCGRWPVPDWKPDPENSNRTYVMGVGEWLTTERRIACDVCCLAHKPNTGEDRKVVHAARKSVARLIAKLTEWHWIDTQPLEHRHDGLRLILTVPTEIASQLCRPNQNTNKIIENTNDTDYEQTVRVPTTLSRVPTRVPTSITIEGNVNAGLNDVSTFSASQPASQPTYGKAPGKGVAFALVSAFQGYGVQFDSSDLARAAEMLNGLDFERIVLEYVDGQAVDAMTVGAFESYLAFMGYGDAA